jgi:hypothetical protein
VSQQQAGSGIESISMLRRLSGIPLLIFLVNAEDSIKKQSCDVAGLSIRSPPMIWESGQFPSVSAGRNKKSWMKNLR